MTKIDVTSVCLWKGLSLSLRAPSQSVATLGSAQHPIRQPRPDRGQSVASDPRHLTTAAIHEAPTTFTQIRVNQAHCVLIQQHP